MSRDLPAEHTREAYKQETSEAWIDLITIDHRELVQPIRVSANHAPVSSGGELYTSFPVRVIRPSDGDTGANLEISNVDQQIIGVLRGITTPATIDIRTVLASDPNIVVQTFEGLEWRQVNFNAGTINGKLAVQFYNQEYLTGQFTASRYPGLF